MRKFLYSIMTDKRKGALYDAPLKLALHLVSFFYGLGLIFRKLFYDVGLFKARRVPLKVISVGNLTLGGTGKTPFVMTLARILKDELKKEVSVLIRGYGWDEQAMLKRGLPDIPVLVGADRARSARRSIKLYGSDTAILDDGFQHWELERNLDIVLIDSRDPFGNGHLFPRGILREPKSSLERADVVVFTKINKKISNISTMREDIKKLNRDVIFLEAMHKPRHLYDARSSKILELSFAGRKRVMLVSSIGDPAYFEETVKDLHTDVVGHFVFSDHHNYSERDISQTTARCAKEDFDMIITTEKDAVKLERMKLSFGSLNLLVLTVDMEIVEGKEILIDRLHSLYSS